MTCPDSTWNELWYQGLSKDFLTSSYIKSSEGKTIFYPWANSGLIVWVVCWNHLRDGTHTVFYAKKTKTPSPTFNNLSLIIFTCVSHDWVCYFRNHQSIIPNRGKSDKTQCSWLRSVWLWTQYCIYSRMLEWIEAAAFERMSIRSDLITI